MKQDEFYLLKLIKECNELALAASKTIQFGAGSVYNGTTNLHEMHVEFNNILAIVEIINERLGYGLISNSDMIEAKKKKVEFFLSASKNLGKVVDS